METNYATHATLKSDRSFLKVLLLGIITLGIYPLCIWYAMVRDINTVCTPHDGKKTMNYILMLIVSPLTLGIVPLVWNHRVSNRLGNELRRRGLESNFSASTFWLWGILGALIIVGPLVYCYRFIKASNQLNADYNARG
ncbi:MAG: DUF4234 domain-containing protein [Clostridia bacterium]|nr:DUF4234 domain-containing protein [Clostridia bacterium]